MARPRNPETVDKIIAASKRLFRLKGYSATSYSDLSAESGVNRATVQDYFPKKRILAIDQLSRLREASTELARREFPQHPGSLAQHYLLGQIYLSALLSCDGSRLFLCDILQDRSMMEDEIERDLAWSMSFVDIVWLDLDPKHEEYYQSMVAAMGGLWELMYYSVKTGRPVDIPRRLVVAMRTLAMHMPMSKDEREAVFAECAIEGPRLQELGFEAFSMAFDA